MNKQKEKRFLDASVFLHASLTPDRELRQREKEIKNTAQNILKRIIDKGENTVISTVHLSEILNIIEAREKLGKCLDILETLLALENLEIVEVDRKKYETAFLRAERYNVSPNDAIAYTIMKKRGITAIYSFDTHFDNFPNIQRIHSLTE